MLKKSAAVHRQKASLPAAPGLRGFEMLLAPCRRSGVTPAAGEDST